MSAESEKKSERLDFSVFKYFFNFYFRPGIVKNSVRRRKGECKACGKCCSDLLNIKNLKCPFLKGGVCRIYKWRKHIPILRAFCCYLPVEECKTRVKECGFYWQKP